VTMARIGLIGGTFDPLHNGHCELVQAALRWGLDRVVVMPAGRPPHKSAEAVSMAGYRFEMACQAFAGLPSVQVSDQEIIRPGRSFTLDTVHQLQAEMPGDELFLVYGSDILTQIEQWHEPEAILAACPMLLAQRGGLDNDAIRHKAERLRQQFGARIQFFDTAPIDLSSSQIRQAIMAGRPYLSLLPDKVGKVIRKHGIYRYLAEMEGLDRSLWLRLFEFERMLWPLLDRKRLLHSLNVMMYSLHLARIHGVPAEQAGIAAILHDCAKCLPAEEAVRLAGPGEDPTLLSPALVHGPAGCFLAAEDFHIEDPAILQAIRYHTTGFAQMTKLDQIIFIADKVEPARTYENLGEIRRLAEFDLDAAMLICLQEIDLFLRREKLPPHPLTHEAFVTIRQRLDNRNDLNADGHLADSSPNNLERR
jgi:nicotinate-nucleotide adenylyltransferase